MRTWIGAYNAAKDGTDALARLLVELIELEPRLITSVLDGFAKKMEALKKEAAARSRATLPPEIEQRYRAVLPHGVGRTKPGRGDEYISRAPSGWAFVATDEIAEAGIREGDVLLLIHMDRITRAQRRAVRGTMVRVPRAAYVALIEAQDRLVYADDSWSDSWSGLPEFNPREEFFKRLASIHKRWISLGRKAEDATSKLLILRPLVEPVSQPLEAPTDDAAIFELLAEVGCRMPDERGS